MSQTVEFYFDYASPSAYLGWHKLRTLQESAGIAVVNRPMLLGGVFKMTGNRPPAVVAAKGVYLFKELARFSQEAGAALRFNPNFPVNSLAIMRGAIAALEEDWFDAYHDAMFKAMWEQEKDLGDPAVLAEVLSGVGLDPAHFQARVSDPAVKEKLKVATSDAVARGVFGAPTFFVEDEMFFGQDRLHWVKDALGV